MAYFTLKYVTKDRDRHGNVRFYFRRPGKPKIRLHGLPGSDEFMTAYRAALSEKQSVGIEGREEFRVALRSLLQVGPFSVA